VDFFNQINLLYGSITEFCTQETCSCMSAGPQYEYHWVRRAPVSCFACARILAQLRRLTRALWQADGVNIKKPIQCSAPEYVDYLMTWVQQQLDDEAIFPSELGVPFPKDFETRLKNIYKRLFRVYAHMYHSHIEKIITLGKALPLLPSLPPSPPPAAPSRSSFPLPLPRLSACARGLYPFLPSLLPCISLSHRLHQQAQNRT